MVQDTNTASGTADLKTRLRNACASVRTKSYPLSDLIPLMQEAADALQTAIRLLRDAAQELAEGISVRGVPDWKGEPDAASAYDETMAAVVALEAHQAEHIALQQGYDAARLEIESLKAQIAAALPGQQDYPESPMKKVAQALREKAEAERGAFDRRIQSGEWGPEPEPGTEADSWVLPEPVSDVWTTFRGERRLTPAGDDYYTSVQVRAAYEAGLAAPPTAQAAPVAQGDAEDAARYRYLKSQASEQLLNPRAALSEICPDMRTHWKLPTLICSGPVGGYLDFDASIDAVRSQDKQGANHD